MAKGMVDLHSILRWVVLLLLLVTLIMAFTRNASIRPTSLWLLTTAHVMFLIGIYQVIAGRYGILKGRHSNAESLMQDDFYRFFWIEHPLMMLIAIILITAARGKAKALNYKAAGWLYFIALVLILAAVPWPFRDVVGRPWLPGM